MNKKNVKGKIRKGNISIDPEQKPWPHELRTARTLALAGYNVKFLPESNLTSADILLDGVESSTRYHSPQLAARELTLHTQCVARMSVLTDIRPVGRNIPRILTWSKCKAHSLRFGACSGDVDFEIKAPKTSKTSSLEQVIRKALKQSPNIIIDSYRMGIRDDVAEKFLIKKCREQNK